MLIERQKGVIQTMSRKLRSAIHAVRVERFYTLSGPPNPIKPRIACDIRCITHYTPGMAAELTRIKGFEVRWKHRFDLGHRCYLTMHDGKAIGYGWVSLGTWLLGLEEPLGMLAPDVGFIFDEITLPQFRGNRLGPARLSCMASDMATLGYPRSCQLISDDNIASQCSAMAAGYKRTESVIRMHRYALRIRVPEGSPPAELGSTTHPSYFAAATAHLVLGRG